MLALSWILTALAYFGGGAFLAIRIIGTGILGETLTLVDCIIWAIVVFVGLGFIAHLVATNAVEKKRCGASMAVYIISFIPYILPTVALVILVQILRLIDFVVYLVSDTHVVAQFVNTATEALIGKQFAVFSGAGTLDDRGSVSPTEYYEVYTSMGNRRKLQFIESKEDIDPDSPYYMKHYSYFRDDIGNYWRSYDGNSKFIPENHGISGKVDW